MGIFQVESRGMRRVLTSMRPTEFEHIVAVLALYRPGPMEFIDDYIAGMHGEEARLRPSGAGADPGRDLWHLRLPGADHPHPDRHCRLHAWRRGPGPQGGGQKDPGAAGPPPGRVRRRAPRNTAAWTRLRPTRSLTPSSILPAMALTRPTPPTMPSSPARPPISRPTTRSSI